MPEAITKFAINSTLGTPEFKPLDQYFLSMTHIAPSDAIIDIIEQQTSVKITDDIIYNYKMNTTGIARIKASGAWSADDNFSVAYKLNNADYVSIIAGWGHGYDAQKEGSMDIPVGAGDIISIKLGAYENRVHVQNLNVSMCGTPYVSHPNGVWEVI